MDLAFRPTSVAFAGIAVAAAVGLMLGGAMKPVLDVGDGPAGPQILGPQAALRSYDGGGTQLAYANYRWGIPDYVVGTDWVAGGPEADVVEPDYEPAAYEPEPYEPEPVTFTAQTWQEPPAEPVVYPSMGGGVLAAETAAP